MPTDSTDPKPQKPLPSAAEINAYLERSAARTKLRLPLAKGDALLERAAAEKLATAPSPATAPPAAAVATDAGASALEGGLHSGKNASRALPVHGAKKLRTAPSPSSSTPLPQSPAPAAPSKDAGAAAEEPAWRPFSDD